LASPIPQLHGQVDFDRSLADLDVLAQVIEAEHIGLHDPRASGHIFDTKSAVLVSHREQDSFALCGFDGRAWNRQAFRFHYAGLPQTQSRKEQRKETHASRKKFVRDQDRASSAGVIFWC